MLVWRLMVVGPLRGSGGGDDDDADEIRTAVKKYI